MARIEPIQAQRGIDTGGVPSTRLDDGMGRGLQALGGALSDAAQSQQAISLRLEQMKFANEDFANAEEFARFKTGFAGRFAELETSIDPKGLDFTKRTLEAYDKEAAKFIATVPTAHRTKYAELVATTRATFGERAVAAELDKRDSWFATSVAERTNELGANVAQNPGLFDLSVEDGLTFIDSTGWSQPQKDEAKKKFRQQMELAKAGHYERVNPDYLLGPKRPSGSMGILDAIEDVESSGDASAVSGKGAVGLMQVMPATAHEIAKELGDTNFPHVGTDATVTEYLKDRTVSRRYGAHYFDKMLSRYGGDVEAALVAYNGGPARADAWINSGRDDSVIPAETRANRQKVLGKVGETGGRRPADGDLPIVTRHGAGRVSAPDMSGLQPAVVERFKQVQNVFGRSIPIVSGYRDPARNAKAVGAKSSRHMHGDALDLDVSELTETERVELIRTASALGFTGIGVYGNSIHLDTGNRRAWGPTHKGDSVPGWAKAAIGEHLAGNAQPQGGVGGSDGVYLHPEFANLPLSERLAIYDRARAASAARATAAQQAYNADIKRRGDALDLGIETGSVGSREEILQAGLPDDTTATLLRRFDSRNREDEQSRSLLAAMENGGVSVNPFDTEQRRIADNAFKYLQRTTPPEEVNAAAVRFIERTHVIPDPIQALLRQAASSSSAAELAQGLALADEIERMAPVDFRNFAGGGEVRDRLALFRDLVNNRGLSGEQAARSLLDASKPEKVISREVLKEQANTEMKKLAVTDVTRELGYFWGIGSPDAPMLPEQQNVMLSEYRSRFEEHFYATGGNADHAKTLAKRDMLDVWKPTGISGSETMMRMAPELYYPAIDGSHEYLRADALQTATDYVSEMFPGREVVNVTILASDKTRADVEANRPPRYRLFYEFKDETGIARFDEVLMDDASGWGVPASDLSRLTAADASSRETRFVTGWGQTRAISDQALREHDAAVRAIDSTEGPDWMRAQAGEVARLRTRLNIGAPETIEDQLSGQRQDMLNEFRDQQGAQ